MYYAVKLFFENCFGIVLAFFCHFLVTLVIVITHKRKDCNETELLTDDRYKCFHFPESSSVIWNGNEMFSQKTTYLRARQEIRKQYNAVFPAELASQVPVFFYFLSRHSIRFPMDQEVVNFRKILPQLKEKLLASGKLELAVANELKTWQLFIHPSEAARVTLSGKSETAVIGKFLLPLCVTFNIFN